MLGHIFSPYFCEISCLPCYVHRLHINTIFMHTVDFESDSWLYRIFEIYHVNYTDICSILYLDTFSVHFSVKSHVYHVKYTDCK